MFRNAYVEEIHGLEQVRAYTKQLRVMLDSKYETADLNKVMKNQYQHLTETEHYKFLKLLHNLMDH